MGAADPTKGITMATDRDHPDFEPAHTSSPTDRVLTELQLFGHRPFQEEPDPRPLPEGAAVGGAIADFDSELHRRTTSRLLWSVSPRPRPGPARARRQ